LKWAIPGPSCGKTGGVTVQLNHTIVHAADPSASARWLADLLGVEASPQWGPFFPVRVDGTELDYMENRGSFTAQHYAFLVSDDVFDAALNRLSEQGAQIWADPHKQHPGAINHDDGGKGVYFEDKEGHLMELITVPYGGWPS
jgi:catechol 2,3-dioxygenase-like lactoylglutathione lyase family enzyme